jgi:hypothetical protein
MVLKRMMPATAVVLAAAPAAAVDPQSAAKMLEPSVVRVLAIGPDGAASGTRQM